MQNKKEYFHLLEQTIKWNADRGNTPNTLDWKLEIAMLQEELNELKSAKTDVDRLDALEDLKFVLTGSQGKMGLTPHQIVECTSIVVEANKQKSTTKNSDGKITKPTDFISPEPALQKILDRR